MKKPPPKQPPTEDEIKAILTALGKKFQALRKKRGYKNHELFAYENDLPRAQYWRYENGSDMKVSSLIKVLHALGISLEDYFKSLE